jgi:hypothetical protein
LSRFVAEIHQCFQIAVHGSVPPTRQKRDKGLAMVDPDGLPLETAIERAVGPLEPLFAAFSAAAAYRRPPGAWRPPDPEDVRLSCLSGAVGRDDCALSPLAGRRRVDRQRPALESDWRAVVAATARRNRATQHQDAWRISFTVRSWRRAAVWVILAGAGAGAGCGACACIRARFPVE